MAQDCDHSYIFYLDLMCELIQNRYGFYEMMDSSGLMFLLTKINYFKFLGP